jgi:hypothetical protein
MRMRGRWGWCWVVVQWYGGGWWAPEGVEGAVQRTDHHSRPSQSGSLAVSLVVFISTYPQPTAHVRPSSSIIHTPHTPSIQHMTLMHSVFPFTLLCPSLSSTLVCTPPNYSVLGALHHAVHCCWPAGGPDLTRIVAQPSPCSPAHPNPPLQFSQLNLGNISSSRFRDPCLFSGRSSSYRSCYHPLDASRRVLVCPRPRPTSIAPVLSASPKHPYPVNCPCIQFGKCSCQRIVTLARRQVRGDGQE